MKIVIRTRPAKNSLLGLASLLAALALVLTAAPARAAGGNVLHGHVPDYVSRSSPTGSLPGKTNLNIVIGLPLRNKPALDSLLRQIYDPASPQYRHYLSPDEFAARFGPTTEDYEALKAFAVSNNLVITGTHPNRTLLDVRGSVADIERVFHTHLHTYKHPTESRDFYAPEGDVSLDIQIPVIDVTGLDNYAIPRPMVHPSASGADHAHPASGSGSSGTYAGKDFRAAYAPGVTLTGAGQSVGLIEFDSGFYVSDITNYEATYPNAYGLPDVPLVVVAIDGLDGSAGANNVEVALDIEMAVDMAPGLNSVVVYEGTSGNDLLNRMATDNICKQLSASWTQYASGASSDQIWQQMAAQGQSFFTASGDNGAYVGSPAAPTDDTNITVVGGTTLSTTGAGGTWTTEQVWNWNTTGGGTDAGGGGISTTYGIPWWQQGISMASNQGSTTFRNLPDVAMTANQVWVISTGHTGSYGGTSCATPLWAAYTSLVNEQAHANGWPYMGFMNPALYNIGKGSSYASAFHDIVIGNDTNAASPTHYFSAPGYDLCTGWGTPSTAVLINLLATPPVFAANPPNDQHNVGFQPVLAWSLGASSPFKYSDLYFGTDPVSVGSATTNSPQYVSRMSVTNYAVPGTLLNNTQYFWRVDGVTAAGVATPGQVWSFTTSPDSLHADLRMHLTLDTRDTIAPTTYDLSGPPFKDATMVSGPTTVPGIANQAMNFSSSSKQSLSLPALSLYTSNVTFLAWVKRTGTPVDYTGLVYYHTASTVAGMDIRNTGALAYNWNNDINNYNWASGLIIPTNQWVLAAIVVSPTQEVAYLGLTNGTLSSATHVYPHVTQAFDGPGNIAWDSSATNRYFNGSLDEVCVWRRALSSAEIGQILTNGINGTSFEGPAPSPVPGTWTWTGAADNTWTNIANWSSAAIPGTTNLVIFDSSSLSNLSTHLTESFNIPGFYVDGSLRTVGVSNAPGGSLVLGASGITLSNCFTSFILDATTFATTPQTWTVPYDASITVLTNLIKGGIPITLSNNGVVSFNGPISGAGGLVFLGTGSNYLNGTSSYSGTNIVGGGTVIAGNSSAFGGSTAFVISNGATVDINGYSEAQKSFMVQGTGVNGVGAITSSGGEQLSAINNFIMQGDTTVNSGAGGWGFYNPGGITAFQANGFALTKIGGPDIWINNVGFTGLGTINVNEGLLGFEGNTDMGVSTNPVNVATGASLGFTASSAALNKLVNLADGASFVCEGSGNFSGPINLNGNGIINSTGQLTLLGYFSGPGYITLAGPGTVVLNSDGNFTWSGNCVLNAGALSISGDGELGIPPASFTPSNIVINGGALMATGSFTLNTNRGIVLGPSVSTGTGSIDVSAGNTLTLDSPLANNGAGSNSLTKIDNGILALGVANTYTSDTIISGGTLEPLVQGAIPGGSGFGNVNVQANGTLNLNGVSVGINGLNGSGVVEAGTGPATLTFGNNNATASFGGSLTDNGGPLSIAKTGAGIEYLTSASTYTYSGSTTVNQGVLQLQHDALLHLSFDSVSGNGNGAIVTNIGTGGASMNGVITGTGAAITANGKFGNAMTFNGTGTYLRITNTVTALDGDTTGINWTLAAWIKTSLAGAILAYQGDGSWASDNTTFYLNKGTNSAGTHIGAVRYGGGWLTGNATVNDGNWHFITITCAGGSKVLYLDGNVDASFTGSTWPNVGEGGQVWLGASPDTGDGDVSMNGLIDEFYMFNRALSQAEVQSLLVSNSIPGQPLLPATTDVTVASGATLDLGGTTETIDSLSGPAGATVKLGSSSAGFLSINSQINTTFSGAITGLGTLVETGAAVQTLAGNNTFNGPTVISNGTLLVNGTLGTNAVTVFGGTLGGTGTIAGPVVVQSSGTFAPGNPTGALTFGSSLSLGGTTLMALNNSVSTNSAANVAGALTLGGALVVSNVGPALVVSNFFQLFTAGSFNGNFTSVTLPPPPAGALWSTNNLATMGVIQLVTAPTPVILPITLTGNSFNIQVATQPGFNYVLQATTNIVDPVVWTNVSTNLGDGTTLSLPVTIDPQSGQNFYRFMVY